MNDWRIVHCSPEIRWSGDIKWLAHISVNISAKLLNISGMRKFIILKNVNNAQVCIFHHCL